jgi:uncharacterized protein YndB with AHSA1/START domain
MRRSQTIALQIERPYAAVYKFLADPRNFAQWAAVDSASFVPIGDETNDWRAMTPGGLRHYRFTPINGFGVLDHALFVPGEVPMFTPMRVFANEEGTELTFTFFRRAGMSDEEFDSTIEWITTDFLTLKSVLETWPRR